MMRAMRHPLDIPDAELARFARGEHRSIQEHLGAHPQRRDGQAGCRVAVWAPHATGVSLLTDRNGWTPGVDPLLRRDPVGVWEGFVPGLGPGDLYKFRIETPHGAGEKADPFGRAMELRPDTASRVVGSSDHTWGDDAWLRSRARDLAQPLSIYEVHLGSWRPGDGEDAERWGSFAEIAAELVPYVRDLGFTHLELLPITEHPYDGSWGYQTLGYFAPTSRYGTPDDLRALIDAAHRAGLGVLLDWVPAHFPRDGHGLVWFDGTHLFEHADPRRGAHPEWGTVVFDYGRPEVQSFLISSALYWLREFHFDGLRVDAVASMLYLDYGRNEGEWVPNEFGGRENLEAVAFLRALNQAVDEECPGSWMCAEESTTWPQVTGPVEEGGLGFHLKWNMGWMHDTLKYMSTDPLLRSGLHDLLSFSIHYAWSEQFLLPLSHDEVVHGKSSLLGRMPGDPEGKPAHLRLLFAAMWAHPGRKLLFMGGEFGQWSEWNHEVGLEWQLLEHAPHRMLHDWVAALNSLYRTERALHQLDAHWTGFEWVDFTDRDHGILVFQRRSDEPLEIVLVVLHFTPVFRPARRVGAPVPGRYLQVLGSDEPRFGGEDRVPRQLHTEAEPCHGQEDSLVLDLPPLGAVFLKAVRPGPEPA